MFGNVYAKTTSKSKLVYKKIFDKPSQQCYNTVIKSL